LPDSPDFETPERVVAIGRPAAALAWLIDSGLLPRERFEAVARQCLHEFAQKPAKEARALQRLYILEAVDSDFYNAACEKADEEVRRYNKFRNSVLAVVAIAALAFGWCVFQPDAVPACQSVNVETAVIDMITKSRVLSSESDSKRTAALTSTPVLNDIQEVGYSRSKRLRGCIAALDYGSVKGPIGYIVSLSRDEPFSSKDDDRITVHGARAEEVRARFKSKE
jgi:hypothetical protein